MSQYKIPPGVFDILPVDDNDAWKSTYLWQFLENVIRETANNFGYREMRTPIFERTELFSRGVGEGTDIVSKEMYTFIDRGERSMSLRPEGTAPAMRAFIQNKRYNQGSVHKYYYIGPMFRYERSQAGRYRQHHQFGIEAIGNRSAEQDAEVIDLIYTVYKRLGLQNLTVCINTLGSKEERGKFRDALKAYFMQFRDVLSDDSQRRLEENPLRILDSKADQDQEAIANAPSILDYLSGESLSRFEMLQDLLSQIEIPFEITPRLVRGLDYYNHTVFEIVSGDLGAQNSLVGGGRYDGLIKTLGGPDLPAIGFGCGLERVIQTMLKQVVSLPQADSPLLYFIPLGQKARQACFNLTHRLRVAGIDVEMDYSGKKLNKVMQHANQQRARFVAVVGERELEDGVVSLKEMESGNEHPAPLYHLENILLLEQKRSILNEATAILWKPLKDPMEQNYFMSSIDKSIQKTAEWAQEMKETLDAMEWTREQIDELNESKEKTSEHNK